MSSRIPDFVDPWRLANQGKHFSGSVQLKALPRLSELILDGEGSVEFDLSFRRDENRRVRIGGFVRSCLSLECQRCLEPMQLPVDATVDLAVIEVPEEAEYLPPECDPVLAEEGGLRLLDLVEDELLLAIPQVPMHGEASCRSPIGDPGPDASTEARDEENRSNPFAVLAGLKKD